MLDKALDVMPMPFSFKCQVFGLLLLFFVAMVAGENVVVSGALGKRGRITRVIVTQCTPGFSHTVRRRQRGVAADAVAIIKHSSQRHVAFNSAVK